MASSEDSNKKPRFVPRISTSSARNTNIDAKLPGALPSLLGKTTAIAPERSRTQVNAPAIAVAEKKKKKKDKEEQGRVAFSASTKSSSSSSSSSAVLVSRGVKKESPRIKKEDKGRELFEDQELLKEMDVDVAQYEPVEFVGIEIEREFEEDENIREDLRGPGDAICSGKQGEFFFVQFPKKIPGYEEKQPEEDKKMTTNAEEGETEINEDEDFEDEEEVNKKKSDASSKNVLTMLNGEIGTLRVYRSGRTKLLFNDGTEYDIDFGVPYPFEQELASIRIDDQIQSGDFQRLGDIKHRIVCSLDPSNL